MQKAEFDELTNELADREEFLTKLEEGNYELCVSYKSGVYVTSRLHTLDDVEMKFIKEHSENIVKELREELSEVIHNL
jgi:hypothetical protein